MKAKHHGNHSFWGSTNEPTGFHSEVLSLRSRVRRDWASHRKEVGDLPASGRQGLLAQSPTWSWLRFFLRAWCGRGDQAGNIRNPTVTAKDVGGFWHVTKQVILWN